MSKRVLRMHDVKKSSEKILQQMGKIVSSVEFERMGAELSRAMAPVSVEISVETIGAVLGESNVRPVVLEVAVKDLPDVVPFVAKRVEAFMNAAVERGVFNNAQVNVSFRRC